MKEKKNGCIQKRINQHRLHGTSSEIKILLGELLASQCSTSTKACLGSRATPEQDCVKVSWKRRRWQIKTIALNSAQELPGSVYLYSQCHTPHFAPAFNFTHL